MLGGTSGCECSYNGKRVIRVNALVDVWRHARRKAETGWKN